jgi:hypothetical protein
MRRDVGVVRSTTDEHAAGRCALVLGIGADRVVVVAAARTGQGEGGEHDDRSRARAATLVVVEAN